MIAETVDAVLISGAIGDREALDAVDPARAKADGGRRPLAMSGMASAMALKMSSISSLARRAPRVTLSSLGRMSGVRGDLPTYVDVCSLPM